jgi:hypothetical protein
MTRAADSTPLTTIPSRLATPDPALAAVVVAQVPLHYQAGADEGLDRPGHVRAGSSLARVPGGIALVQDDANFVALFEPDGVEVRAIALPAGEGGRRQFDDRRGNKEHKLDLEACFAVADEGGTLLIALGSGSTPRREQVATVRGWEHDAPEVTVVRAAGLYAALRAEAAFAGSELNVEGAVHLGDRVRLFGRGNGAARDDQRPVNATCDLPWPPFLAHLRAPDHAAAPTPRDVVHYELGRIDGIALGFTDAATIGGGTLLYSAAAEDSPDATRDGRVSGSAIGVIDPAGETRWAPLTEPSGAIFAGKVEGLLPADAAGERLYVVVDADDPDAPSVLCTVELRGPWRR